MSSSWTPPRTTRSTTCAVCSSGPGRHRPTCAGRSTSSTRSSGSERAGTSCFATLEEPPDHVAFIFCTTDPSQIRPAVLSRVQRFDFRPLTVPQIEGKLDTILEADGRLADPAAVELVARQAAGGMRDAESMLDQLLASSGDRLTVEAVRDLLGLVDAEVIDGFLDALVRGDALAGLPDPRRPRGDGPRPGRLPRPARRCAARRTRRGAGRHRPTSRPVGGSTS